MPFQDGVSGNLVVAVAPDFYAIPERTDITFVSFPGEGAHLVKNGNTIFVDPAPVLFPNDFSLHPAPFFRDLVCRLHGPFVDAVVVIDIPVHVDPIGGDVKVQNTAGAVVMEHGDILAIPDVRRLGAGALRLSREIHGIERPDEIIREFDPVLQRPAGGFFLGRGNLDLDHCVDQRSVTVQLCAVFQLGSLHHLPHGG